MQSSSENMDDKDACCVCNNWEERPTKKPLLSPQPTEIL